MANPPSAKSAYAHVLTINGGSSSIKFAVFEFGDLLRRILEGGIDRIGLPDTTLLVQGLNKADNFSRLVTAPNHTVAVGILMEIQECRGRAAEAVALFCYQVKKWIGAFSVALGGLDTLVFSGGIGESAPSVRTGICHGLGFLGIKLDEKKNAANGGVISAAASGVAVTVIGTDEERIIAKMVCRVLGLGQKKKD